MFDPAGRSSPRYIWSLSWPLMVANVLELAVGLVDLWLVRPFGPSAIAAIGLGRQVTFLVEAMAVGITAGAIALVSQGVAARSRTAAVTGETTGHSPDSAVRIIDPDEVVRQSMGLVLLLGLPVSFAGYWLSEPLLVSLQADSETRSHGTPYLQIYFGGIILTWGNLVAAALFRGAGNVWTPLKVALGVSFLQVVLNYCFVYGAGPLPSFEVRGAAMGTVAARGCGMAAYLFLLVRGTGPLRLRLSSVPGSNSSRVRSMLRIGVPVALANLFRHGSRVVFLAIAGASTMGLPLQAALGVALQLRLVSVLVALAFQTAGATLVGQAIGRGDFSQAAQVGRGSLRLLALLLGIVSGAILLLADPLAGFFLDTPEVADLGARVLRWFAVAQFMSGLSIGMQGVLLGAGDTLPAMRYTLISEWCLMLPLAYLAVVTDRVPDGLLAGWVLAPTLTLILMQRRFRSGCWLKERA